jgi:Lhr-like helicase
MSEQLIATMADTSRIAQNHSKKERFEEIAKRMKDCVHIIKSMTVGPHDREISFDKLQRDTYGR